VNINYSNLISGKYGDLVRRYGAGALRWWGGQSRIRQAGYMAGGGYLSLLAISRVGRALTARRGILRDYPAPRDVRAIYRRTPTAGLVQQAHRDRIGHTSYGSARTYPIGLGLR